MRDSTNSWRFLIKLTLPVAMGYYAAGIAYGILGIGNGLPAWLVVLLSIVVYSGAAQYAAIPLLATGAGFIPLVVGTLLISLRQIFYTLALYSDLPKNRLARWYSSASITDESYAIACSQPLAQRRANLLKINFLCQFYWVSASLIGVVLGEKFAGVIPHLDFALPCLFLILAYEQYRQIKRLFPIVLAFFAFLLAKWLFPTWVLLAAILFCVLVLLLRYNIFQNNALSKSH